MAPLSATPDVLNPFMVLVNAATSVSQKQEPQEAKATILESKPESTSDTPSTGAVSDEDSRSSEPKKSFAETLMTLLLAKEYAHVVTFLPDQQSFGIIHAKKFSDEVMPKVFGINTFSSFVRKLNRWGFERIMEKKTHDVDVFRHSLFRKGDWKMCAQIKCVGRAKNRKSADIAKEVLLRRSSATMTMATLPSRQPQVATPTMPSTTRNVKDALKAQASLHESHAIQDVTSHVVGAALQTLRRDEVVATARGNLQQLMQRERARAQLMLLRHTQQSQSSAAASKLLAQHISPRSSMTLF